MNNGVIRVIVDMTADCRNITSHTDSTGHGFSVYYNGSNQFVTEFLSRTCMWGGSTAEHTAYDGKYKLFEFSYNDKALFGLACVEKMLRENGTELDIAYTNEDMQKFWFGKILDIKED